MPEPRDPCAPTPRADARRNRDRILQAGAELLAENSAATLGEIAQAAGISRATVYRHFTDVDALRAALLDEAQEVGRELLREHLPPMLGPTGSATADELLDLFRTMVPMEHRWTKMMAGESHPDDAFIESFAPVARGLVKRGQMRGDFRADLDLDLASEALISLAMFVVRKVHGEGVDVDRALGVMRIYLDGMVPRRAR
jgi:TetR/AcrR family transcriptional repressor of mexCD-oprJ operon